MTKNAVQGGTIWDVDSGKPLRSFHGERPSFSPDGRFVIAVANTPMIEGPMICEAYLYDARSEKWRGFEHKSSVQDAAFSPDGRLVVTASFDGAARVFDLRSGKQILLLEHGAPVYRAVFSPDGGRIATADEKGVVRLWDAKRGQLLYKLYGHDTEPRTITFSTDGDLLLSVVKAPDRGVVRLWDVHMEREPAARVAAEIERLVPVEVMNTVVRQTFDTK
jgi:WD40 repeat protein